MDDSRSRSTLNRRGQALSEYAVLVAIVGMGLVVILGLFGRATKQVWQNSESKFAGGESSVASAPSGAAPAPIPAPSGGGAASGSVQPTPPPSSEPPPPPKQNSSDSSSAAPDSAGTAPGDPLGGSPKTGEDFAP